MKRDRNKILFASSRKRWDVEKNASVIRVIPADINLWVNLIKYIAALLLCLPFILFVKPLYMPMFVYALFVLFFGILDYVDWSDRKKGLCFLCDIESGNVQLPRNEIIVQLSDVIGLNVGSWRGEGNAITLMLQYYENGESRESLVLISGRKHVINIGNEIATFAEKNFSESI